jgi:glucokinase-like ROK family protein
MQDPVTPLSPRRNGGDADHATPAGARGLVAVLDQLRGGRLYSRPELERETGLSRAVVAQRVAELIERGLVDEPHLGPSAGGRAPRMVRFRADAGRLLVADVGATSIDAAVADLSCRILAHRSLSADVATGPGEVLAHVDSLFAAVLGEAGAPRSSLRGIGIGVPGPVDPARGRPVSPPVMPGWDGFPIADRFAERYGVPVCVDNDVNVMALGELRAGGARGHDDVVFVKVGTGIGAGVVSGGRLHRGAQGAAGDVGHIQVGAGAICRCGKDGCLEALAGGAALARDGVAAAREGRSEQLAATLTQTGTVTAADVASAAVHGDPVSRALITEAGRLIGRMLENVVNMLNPSLVVIGGGVSGAGDPLLAAIRETVYGRSLPLATRDLLIARSLLGARCGVTGAAALVADHLFSVDQVAAWGAGGPATPRAAAAAR